MTRDWTIIRAMLLGQDTSHVDVDTLAYHAWLLVDAGFANGEAAIDQDGKISHVVLHHLTWSGQEVAAYIANSKVFNDVMEIHGGLIPCDLMLDLAGDMLRELHGPKQQAEPVPEPLPAEGQQIDPFADMEQGDNDEDGKED